MFLYEHATARPGRGSLTAAPHQESGVTQPCVEREAHLAFCGRVGRDRNFRYHSFQPNTPPIVSFLLGYEMTSVHITILSKASMKLLSVAGLARPDTGAGVNLGT